MLKLMTIGWMTALAAAPLHASETAVTYEVAAATTAATTAATSPVPAPNAKSQELRSKIQPEGVRPDGTITVSFSANDKSNLPSRLDLEVVCFTQAINAILSRNPQYELTSFMYEPTVLGDTTLLQNTEVKAADGKTPVQMIEIKLFDRTYKEPKTAVAFPRFEQELVTRQSAEGESFTLRANCQVQQLRIWSPQNLIKLQ